MALNQQQLRLDEVDLPLAEGETYCHVAEPRIAGVKRIKPYSYAWCIVTGLTALSIAPQLAYCDEKSSS
jgi:hypothetical protein